MSAAQADATLVPSFAEVEAATRKAARGVGMGWGMAEEMAAAVRRLEAWGEPVLEPLVSHLAALDADRHALQPRGALDGRTEPVCAVLAGVRIADAPGGLVASGTGLPPLACPVLIVPFLCDAAPEDGCLELLTPDAAFVCGRSGFRREPAAAPRWRLRAVEGAAPVCRVVAPREVALRVWDAILAFAARTYVPASDGSRLSGAGAGLSDND